MKYKSKATTITQNLQNQGENLVKRLESNAATKQEVVKVVNAMIRKSKDLQNLIDLERENFAQ
jgi:hypothetical protein